MASERRFLSKWAGGMLGLSLLLGLVSAMGSVAPVFAEAGSGGHLPSQRAALDRFGARLIERHGARSAAASAQSAAADLAAFAVSVANGQASVVRGVYVPGVLALTVVQQPAGAPYFVDMRPGVATQYGAARLTGVTGLLADNLASGVLFYGLVPGQTVSVVYGDGTIRQYSITAALRYQALDPKSPYSNFVDLASGIQVSATELFGQVYTGAGQLVLQTCLAAEGIPAWGRLFVIATPLEY